MAPSPQETMVGDRETIEKPLTTLTGDEVVISGMSGIFPSSNSVLQFKENLYNNVDMVTKAEPRWVFNHPEVSKHLGKVEGIGKFDAQFFKVHYKQAITMEPMSRLLLEHAYSAVFDAGINCLELRGKRVGVFIGSAFSESEKIIIFEIIQRNGFGISGCNRAMYANRISYWMDSKGPSYALDVACASSMACLEHAYKSITSGVCDAAIVGGCNLCMHPNVSLNIRRAGFLCLDGKTRCFDNNADGCVRSDAISVLFVQKAKDAKRIYSQVYHVKGNYSTNPKVDEEFLPTREPKEIQEFFEAFYNEIGMPATNVDYIEAYGSALKKADGNELEAIGRVFTKDGKPVKIGSVKSNMGHSEPASGACALTKACLAFHTGIIPANLHYKDPQNHISWVRDGKIQVVTENTSFDRNGFIALNNFSYSGANLHVLLKGHYKPKDKDRYKTSIPQLVLVSGRQEAAVQKILDALKTHPIDYEEIALLRNINQIHVPGHVGRGYTILDTNEKNETVALVEHAEYFPDIKHPVWFVYSGMGSQWAGMGAELMRIPIFAAAIEKCHKVLEPKGLDIVKILTDPDKTIYDNILNSFVGIAAVQIGLTDILKALDIVPDNIIGHSVGELGCAYADGCFTAEEMILSAYSRGLVSVQTPFIRGSMAAVGLGYKAVLALCPPEIEVACHNSADSSTISGPADIMKEFVAELTSRGIFAKEVPCSNIAYHSRYIAEAGPGLLKYLGEVIKDPKPRSEKWVSTSVPQDKWEEPIAKYSSAEYHTNNLLNSVLFEETSKLIPANAIVVEIAPHGLLQAILKRSLKDCNNIPLTRRGHSDPVRYLLESIGKLFEAGLNPKVDILYPKIEYPVSTETPLLSHLVGWQHSEDWPIARYFIQDRITTIARNFVMTVHDDDYDYMEGHIRDGSYVFPEAALLVLIWETLAMHRGVDYREMSVVFENVQFFGEVYITSEKPLRLGIMMHKGNQQFEVSYEGTDIMTGFIKEVKKNELVYRELVEPEDPEDDILLKTEDIYRIMKLRGFNYQGDFQSIESMNSSFNKATLKWKNQWVTFIDSLIQFNIIARDHEGTSTPKLIKKLSINIEKHNKVQSPEDVEETSEEHNNVQSNEEEVEITSYEARLYNMYGISRCGGVELDGIAFTDIPKVEEEPTVLANNSFIPHFITGEIDVAKSLLINLQIVANNTVGNIVKVTEIVNSKPILSNIINMITKNIVSHDFNVQTIEIQNDSIENLAANGQDIMESDVIILYNSIGNEKKMNKLYKLLKKDAFVLSFEQDTYEIYSITNKQYNVISAASVDKRILMLLRKANFAQKEEVTYLPIVYDNKFSWITKLHSELQKTKRIVLVSQKQPYCGLLGMVKKLRNQHGDKISLVVIDDFMATTFNPENSVYEEQLKKNLAINVLKKGQWGGYYYLPGSKSADLRNVTLVSMISGDHEGLTWVEAPSSKASNNTVQVCYAGVSLKDAKKSIDKDEIDNHPYGMDFSGIDINGERVMGVVQGGALSSTVQADPDLLWPVPKYWTLEEAATVPLAYTFALYCLAIRCELRKNQTIFVSGGAGALGQAIISIALALKCNVFTTVGSAAKKQFLLKMFPELNEENIADSRFDAFSDMIIFRTNNKRCDLAINCASGEQRVAAMKCISKCSDFFDLSHHDMSLNRDFGMSFLSHERNYKGVNLSTIFLPEFYEEKKRLQMIMSEQIAKGVIRPLSRMVFSPLEVSRAFRLVSNNGNRGKVLIRMKDPAMSSQNVKIVPRMSYSSEEPYVIIAENNGLGIELADHLVKKGARKLILHFSANHITGYLYIKLASWKKLGVSLKLSSEKLETQAGCTNLFKEGAKLGPIQGIFFVQDSKAETEGNVEPEYFAQKFNNTALIVANLNLISRNVCPELRHFVVITRFTQNPADEYATSVCEKICEARQELGMPALTLRVVMEEVDQNPNCLQSNVCPQSVHVVFNALDTSLKMKHSNVLSFNLKRQNDTDFLDCIAKIIGEYTLNNCDQDLTVRDLKLKEFNLEEIKTVIKKFYKIHYPTETVQNMTVASLKTIKDNLTIPTTNFDGRLGAFFTYIDVDECQAAEPMVQMPTLLSNATEKEEELDPKATYLMLVPGFEGHHRIFETVCERVKLPALVFQLGPDITNESIPQMAASIMKFMKKRFELKSKFYLLGYSFGVNVALELAALFEKEGHVGVVYCLDSSPDALRVQLDAYVGNMSDTELQNSIIDHMYRLMSGQDSKELMDELKKIDHWTDKIEACVLKLRDIVNYSHEYKRTMLESAYRRILLSQKYEPDFKLESELVLMKGIPHPKTAKLPDDYNLSKYTKQPVKIYDLKSDHALAVYDCRVSSIINRQLEPNLLEDFKKRCLCETYLADPYKIM